MTDKDTILFGKYQLIRTLGRGRNGTVYLALHRELEEYRAIKQVPKTAADYGQFLKEALILKRLRHPGIPIVYDVFDDLQYSYLVEEFLEGDSFYDLVSRRGPLNQDTAVGYGIQICDLIHYLHSAEEIPILYLDLQPRNLIVCHGQVKLLDFDHADTLEESNEAVSRFGTPGYIAPEQWSQEPLGIYTDVYQIGAVLYYLLTGKTETDPSLPGVHGKLAAVIRRCLRRDGEERYGSALELSEELKQLHSNTECLSQSQSSPLIIALVGTRPGAGVTHLSLGLAVSLNRMGYLTLYEERNRSNDMRSMADYLRVHPDSYGIYMLFGQPVKPFYGQAVSLRPPAYPLIVRDYGTDTEKVLAEEDQLAAVWLIREGKWWEKQAPVWQDQEKTSILYNHVVRGAIRRGPDRRPAVRCFQAPVFADPFRPGEEAEAFYRAVLSRSLVLPGQEKGNGLWDCFRRKLRPRRQSRGSSE